MNISNTPAELIRSRLLASEGKLYFKIDPFRILPYLRGSKEPRPEGAGLDCAFIRGLK
jgi:hypothetical protein